MSIRKIFKSFIFISMENFVRFQKLKYENVYKLLYSNTYVMSYQ